MYLRPLTYMNANIVSDGWFLLVAWHKHITTFFQKNNKKNENQAVTSEYNVVVRKNFNCFKRHYSSSKIPK